MCNPLLIMAGVSIGTQVIGGMKAAKEQKAAGIQQGKYFDYSATQSEQAAAAADAVGQARDTAAQNQGAIEAGQLRRKTAELAGTQKVNMAANNMGDGSVTAADIANDTSTKQTLDEAMIRYNADNKSWEAKTQAGYDQANLRNQAGLQRFAGANARKTGAVNSTGTLFNTATSVASSAYTMKTGGVGSTATKIK